jgi:hypothetical protein
MFNGQINLHQCHGLIYVFQQLYASGDKSYCFLLVKSKRAYLQVHH